jgi:hypothetical protein
MSWMKWVSLLQTRLKECPTDSLTRGTLALLLEVDFPGFNGHLYTRFDAASNISGLTPLR